MFLHYIRTLKYVFNKASVLFTYFSLLSSLSCLIALKAYKSFISFSIILMTTGLSIFFPKSNIVYKASKEQPYTSP
jgi:hypothetical protein